MTAPPFDVVFAASAAEVLHALQKMDPAKYKKVRKTLRTLRDPGPSYPSLNTHKYVSLSGPNGADVWESYVENHAPSAWRLWLTYDPVPDQLIIVSIGPHP